MILKLLCLCSEGDVVEDPEDDEDYNDEMMSVLEPQMANVSICGSGAFLFDKMAPPVVNGSTAARKQDLITYCYFFLIFPLQKMYRCNWLPTFAKSTAVRRRKNG